MTVNKKSGIISTGPNAGKPDWAPGFIGFIMQGMTILDAACEVDVHWTMPYKRRRTDEVFAKAWREAAQIATQLMEEEAARRAFHGTMEPVFYKGAACGAIRKYSDTLMIFLLKARRPAKYRDMVEQGKSPPVVVNIFDDIQRDIQLIEADRQADSSIQANGTAKPVDASEAH